MLAAEGARRICFMIGLTARAFILPGMRKTRNPSRLARVVAGAAEVAGSVVLVSMTSVDASTPFWWFLWQTDRGD